ncbi:AraC family transcriptional regulator [Chloroflexia bacterium SDU3-3]|nr:AraC family transcriptional regulator [Chloroflexia bacterium SDU3-3]
MSQPRQWSRAVYEPDLRLESLQANFTTHTFARHWHTHYVIGMVEDGVQSFWCRRDTYTTPRGGLILLNPGEAHTGEAARSGGGFAYRALYPTAAHMASAMAEFGRPDAAPEFTKVRVDDVGMAEIVGRLHMALDASASLLERQSRWLGLLVALVRRFGAAPLRLPRAGDEPLAIARARAILEERYDQRLTLPEIAAQVGLSPYHLLRVFARATDLSPHAYLESIRIRHAQRLIAQGHDLASIAYAVGFSNQSHFTSRFRRVVGITPGRYQLSRRKTARS